MSPRYSMTSVSPVFTLLLLMVVSGGGPAESWSAWDQVDTAAPAGYDPQPLRESGEVFEEEVERSPHQLLRFYVSRSPWRRLLDAYRPQAALRARGRRSDEAALHQMAAGMGSAPADSATSGTQAQTNQNPVDESMSAERVGWNDCMQVIQDESDRRGLTNKARFNFVIPMLLKCVRFMDLAHRPWDADAAAGAGQVAALEDRPLL